MIRENWGLTAAPGFRLGFIAAARGICDWSVLRQGWQIWFHGNPWPTEDRITEFVRTGRLDWERRLWSDLTLITADYFEDGPPTMVDGVERFPGTMMIWPRSGNHTDWANFGKCTISSTEWSDETGIPAAAPEHPFRLNWRGEIVGN